MGLAFGTQDEIDCLSEQNIPGPGGEQLCIASKISLHFVGAGVNVTDGGYVLKIKDSKKFYPLPKERIEVLQADGVLPNPLPGYHIKWHQYAFGYSLWIIIVFSVVAMGLQRLLDKVRPFLAMKVAPSSGPPTTRTDEERWLSTELRKHLEQGERVQHQAFGHNGHETLPAFAVLTDRRLLVLDVAVKGLGGRFEVKGVKAYARDSIRTIGAEALRVVFYLVDETFVDFWVNKSQRKFTNQWLFARDVPKLLLPIAA